MDWMHKLLDWLNGDSKAQIAEKMEKQKKNILVVLDDGKKFWDGSGKSYDQWLSIMTWNTPKYIDFIKENGTHACFHSRRIQYIEERLENE